MPKVTKHPRFLMLQSLLTCCHEKMSDFSQEQSITVVTASSNSLCGSMQLLTACAPVDQTGIFDSWFCGEACVKTTSFALLAFQYWASDKSAKSRTIVSLPPECCQHHMSHTDESPFTVHTCRAGVKVPRQTDTPSVCDAMRCCGLT